jgi:hypothetical protein
VDLEMPSHFYRPGDVCWLDAHVCNPTQSVYVGAPIFVILDVYGTYYFAPSFSLGIDYYVRNVPPGTMTIEVLQPFTWPGGGGSASGIVFWGAQTDPDFTRIIGQLSRWEFGWGS